MIVFATVIQWGILAAMMLINPVPPAKFLQIFLINIFLCPLGGAIWGIWAWTTTEAAYRQSRDS